MSRVVYPVLAVAALFGPIACGGGEAVPAPAAPKPAAVVGVAPAKAHSPELTCKDALAKGDARADALCAPACEAGDGALCFELANRQIREAEPDAKKVEGYLDKACSVGHADACLPLFTLLEADDPARARAALEKGCPAEPTTDATKRSCHTLGVLLGRAGTAEELQASLSYFGRACDAGEMSSCSAKRAAERKIEAMQTPPSVEGKLVSLKGKTVTIKLDAKSDVPVGAAVDVSRQFESKPGQKSPLGLLGNILGGTVRGWVGVAKAKVEKVEGDVVTLTVIEEQSVMRVNGKKVNHFTPAARMRLTTSK